MRHGRSHLAAGRLRGGFTLIEVMFATLLMSVVGMAIVGFMSAFASGIQVRTTISDPPLEASLATRRLASAAPGFSYVLQVNGARAAIWLGDSVPSRMVDLSEIGVVRFDETAGMLVLDTMDPMVVATDPLLDREFLFSSSTDFIGAIDDQRDAGRTVRNILAEGLETVQFSASGVPSGHATVTITLEAGSARIALSPAFVEEPVR
jgi:hypothetical protein